MYEENNSDFAAVGPQLYPLFRDCNDCFFSGMAVRETTTRTGKTAAPKGYRAAQHAHSKTTTGESPVSLLLSA